jgi:hypothetical protein
MLNPMRTIRKRLLARWNCGMAFAFLCLWPMITLAQTAPKSPQLQKTPPVWLGYLVMALLLAVVLAVSLMPSKRSHQD